MSSLTLESWQGVLSITALGGRISVEMALLHTQTATLPALTHAFISSLSDPAHKKSLL